MCPDTRPEAAAHTGGFTAPSAGPAVCEPRAAGRGGPGAAARRAEAHGAGGHSPIVAMYEVAGEPDSVYLRTMEVFPTQDSPAITIFTSSGRGSAASPSPSPAMAGAQCRPGRAGPRRGGAGAGPEPPQRRASR